MSTYIIHKSDIAKDWIAAAGDLELLDVMAEVQQTLNIEQGVAIYEHIEPEENKLRLSIFAWGQDNPELEGYFYCETRGSKEPGFAQRLRDLIHGYFD